MRLSIVTSIALTVLQSGTAVQTITNFRIGVDRFSGYLTLRGGVIHNGKNQKRLENRTATKHS